MDNTLNEMNFTHQLQDTIAVFVLEGSLLGEADRQNLKNEFTAYLEKDVRYFLIDLSNLKHVNSTGLGVFITLYTRVKAKDGEMVIANPSESINNLLTITKLTSVFSIVSSQEEGFKKLKSK
jgi:anti-sigma B factor antagonist